MLKWRKKKNKKQQSKLVKRYIHTKGFLNFPGDHLEREIVISLEIALY